jgi:hypothetical protein
MTAQPPKPTWRHHGLIGLIFVVMLLVVVLVPKIRRWQFQRTTAEVYKEYEAESSEQPSLAAINSYLGSGRLFEVQITYYVPDRGEEIHVAIPESELRQLFQKVVPARHPLPWPAFGEIRFKTEESSRDLHVYKVSENELATTSDHRTYFRGIKLKEYLSLINRAR